MSDSYYRFDPIDEDILINVARTGVSRITGCTGIPQKDMDDWLLYEQDHAQKRLKDLYGDVKGLFRLERKILVPALSLAAEKQPLGVQWWIRSL